MRPRHPPEKSGVLWLLSLFSSDGKLKGQGSLLLCWTIIHSMPVSSCQPRIKFQWVMRIAGYSWLGWPISPGLCLFLGITCSRWLHSVSLIGPGPPRIQAGKGWLILLHCNLLTNWVLAKLQSYFLQCTFISNKPDIAYRNCFVLGYDGDF